MEKEPCLNCGQKDYTTSRRWNEKSLEDGSWNIKQRMTCNKCETQWNGWRDAEGNKITYIPVDGIWHTLGVPINSARELSDHAKKHNLRQAGEVHGKRC